MNFFRSRLLVASAILGGLLSGCAGTTSVNARHDPLYRAETHASTITANASNSRDGISSIRINVVIGEMTACGGSMPSLIPCRTGATTQTRTCTFANPATATCTFILTLGARRLVTYDVEATSGRGSTSRTVSITYAGGASITQAELRFGPISFTIPWDVARPMWWHTSAPAGSGSPDHLDVGFYPDSDWPTYRGFTDAAQPIALGAHFTTATPFSQFYTVFRGGMFNLWAGPPGANAEGCSRSFSGFAQNVAGATDAEAIVHRNEFRDCAAIAMGGSGSVWSGAGDAPWVYTHESGHFIQGLGDEYCCDGGYAAVSTPRNIFNSQAACQSTASAVGLATSLCVQIGTTGAWRMDDGGDSTMEDRTSNSDWRTASGRAVSNRLSDCFNGNC